MSSSLSRSTGIALVLAVGVLAATLADLSQPEVIKPPHTPRDVPFLLARLQQPDRAARIEALRALRTLQQEHIGVIIPALRWRSCAHFALQQEHIGVIIPDIAPLIAMPNDTERGVREETIRVLGATGDLQAFEPFLPLLTAHYSSIRIGTLAALRDLIDANREKGIEIHDPSRLFALIAPLLQDAGPGVRQATVELVGRLGNLVLKDDSVNLLPEGKLTAAAP